MAKPGPKPKPDSPNPRCPHCGSNTSAIKGKPGRYRCNNRQNCGKRYTPNPKKPGPKPTGKAKPSAQRTQESRARTGKTGNEARNLRRESEQEDG